MTKILFVCLGNICRSPLAHGILESKLPSDRFYIDSAGTASYHIGSQPDRRSIKVARNFGIDITNQQARAFQLTDFDTFDIIFGMDKSNYNDIIKLASSEEDIKKVKLFLDENRSILNKNVPDPYYGDMSDFKRVYDLIDETCNMFVNKL